MVAFHARLDYLSQFQLKEVFVKRAKLFVNNFAELDNLLVNDKFKVS